MPATVAHLVADALRRARVARVFVSGDADPALVGALGAAGLALVTVAADASACAMAAVTGALGDAPGAALVAHAVPEVAGALAAALRERAPAIVIASHPPPPDTALRARVALSAAAAAEGIADAVAIAMDEPPGPVWLELDPAVATRETAPGAFARRAPPAVPDDQGLDAVAERLAACARPIIVAGRECRAPSVAGWLRAFAESLPAPVLATPAARGAFPDPHPLAFGALRADAAVLARADLVVALGVDTVELETAHVTLPEATVRLGRGGGEAGAAAVTARGEVALVLEELASRLRGRVRADWDVAELDRLRRAIPAPAVDPALADLVGRVRDATPAGTAAVFSRTLESLTPLWPAVGPGELTVADVPLAAAVAVALARPEHVTVAFARGDDDPLAELQTAVVAGARVVAIVVDGRAVDAAAVRAAGARVVRPLSRPALVAALGGALHGPAPTVIAIARAG